METLELMAPDALVAAIGTTCIERGMREFPARVITIEPSEMGCDRIRLVEVIPCGAGYKARGGLQSAVVARRDVRRIVGRLRSELGNAPCFRRRAIYREGTTVYWWTFVPPPKKPKPKAA